MRLQTKTVKVLRIAVALPVLVCALMVGLVVGSTRAAEAVVIPSAVVTVPAAPVIGGALPGVMEGGAAVAGGACLASVVCAGITGGVTLGIILWSTQDTWLPLLPDALENPLRNLMGAAGACNTALGGSIVAGQLQLNMSFSGCSGLNGAYPYRVSPYSYYAGTGSSGSIVCKDGDNIYTPSYTNPTFFPIGTTGTIYNAGAKTVTMDPCAGVGGALVYWKGNFNLNASPTTTSNTLEVGTALDPDDVSQTTTVTCRKPDGTTGTVTKTLRGEPGKVMIPSCVEAFGAGSYPLSVKMTSGYAGAETPLLDRTWTDPKTQYPSCFHATTGAFLGTCVVQVWVNGTACEIGMGVCSRWETYEADHPGSSVQCKFGPYVLPIANCAMLKGQYRTDAGTKTITEVDTRTGTPVVTDPAVPGTDLPSWVDNICMVNCVKPPVPPVCLEGHDTDCTPGSGGDENCLSDAFSWNPVDWVYVPVKCALKWAFVPPGGTWDDAMGKISDAFDGALSGWDTAIQDGWDSVTPGGAGGCHGPGFSMPDTMTEAGMPATFYPLEACGGVSATVAGYCKLLCTVGLVVLGTVKALRIVQAGLGLSTGVPVTSQGSA